MYYVRYTKTSAIFTRVPYWHRALMLLPFVRRRMLRGKSVMSIHKDRHGVTYEYRNYPEHPELYHPLNVTGPTVTTTLDD